jgi:transposase
MSGKRYSAELKLKAVRAYETGNYTYKEVCTKYQITEHALRDWIKRFEQYGAEGLQKATSWKHYSKEVKEVAVKEYISGEYLLNEIVRRYEISSKSVLRRWINHYNGHRELKDTSKGKVRSMTKGRTTSWEERVQIVLSCLENGKDFKRTAETYTVSYQQIYQWVRKYEDGGDEALKDGRGRKKEGQELSSEEKVKVGMKKLEQENERLRAENAFLKKLEKLERRR